MMEREKRLKLLVSIVERGKGEEVSAFLSKRGLLVQTVLLGEGTAKSDLMQLLSLTQTERDVVLSVCPAARSGELLQEMSELLGMERHGGGIAFSISMGSIGGYAVNQLLQSQEEER